MALTRRGRTPAPPSPPDAPAWPPRPRDDKALEAPAFARLAGLNLNLLPVLDVLLEAGSVSQAASRLGVTQPAMSQTLRQLRDALGDPLLVRQGAAMVRTPRAEALAPLVRQTLLDVGSLFDQSEFDARRARRTFVVGARDYVASEAFAPLVERIRAGAPGVTLRVSTRVHPDDLASGATDLAFAPPRLPPWRRAASLMSRHLFNDPVVCVARRHHPSLRDGLDLDTYVHGVAHIRVSPGADAPALEDRILARLGRRRHVALSVPYFSTALSVVARSDLLATLPRRCAGPFAGPLDLRLVDPPFALPPIGLALFWHVRNQGDAAHRWFREEIIRALTAPSPAGPVDGAHR